MNAPKRCSIQKITYADIAMALPSAVTFATDRFTHVDVLVLAQGFEERTLYVPTELFKTSLISSATAVWVATYETNKADNEERFAQIRPNLDGAGSIKYFSADAPEVADSTLRTLLENVAPNSTIVFDISGASASLIFSVIGAIARCPAPQNFSITYTTAATYYPDQGFTEVSTEERHSADFLETSPRDYGASDPSPHPVFRGYSQDSKPNHIIAVPGLGGYERFARCLAYVSDDETSDSGGTLTVILPHSEDKSHDFRENALLDRINRRFATTDAQDPTIDVERCDFGEYQHIIGSIIERADRHLGSNIALIHFGTKMQSIGAALALLARDEVALIFARPSGFDAAHYSAGIGACRLLELGDIRELVDQLKLIGTIRVSRDEAAPEARFHPAS